MQEVEKFKNSNWGKFLQLDDSFYFQLNNFLENEYKNSVVFPDRKNIFKVFELIEPKQVKVIILGQDPYHQPKQAQGIAFSVPDDLKTPPSLRNIQKELFADLKIEHQNDLTNWVSQGVLLLNTVLTVQEARPNSHNNNLWLEFTTTAIEKLSEMGGVVFVLWGNNAKSFERDIDSKNNFIIKSSHPSPLSANRGFLGSAPFSQINSYLLLQKKSIINWKE